MTLKEAIRRETAARELALKLGNSNSAEAHRLSIEAMKVELEARLGLPKGSYDLLPGETEE